MWKWCMNEKKNCSHSLTSTQSQWTLHFLSCFPQPILQARNVFILIFHLLKLTFTFIEEFRFLYMIQSISLKVSEPVT